MSDEKAAPTQGSKQRLLVGVASKPDAEFTIRWARDLATALKCDWIAVHVEEATRSDESETDVARVLRLAGEFGAETLVTTDEDVVEGLMRVAEQRNATYVVIGRPTAQRTWWGRKTGDRTAIRLLQNSQGRQIYIAASEELVALQNWRGNSVLRRTPKAQYLSVLAAIGALTGAGFVFTPVIGPHATALIFLLVVVGLALLFDRGPALMAATLSAVAWDYFFLPPVFAFDVHSFEDAMFLVIFFAVALALGQLTNRIKTHQVNDRQREAKATALYLLTRELNEARSLNEILATAKAQLETAFQLDSALVVRGSESNFQRPVIEIVDGDWVDERIYKWVIEHSRPAGKSTDKFGDAQALYVPLTNTAGVVGVVALRLSDSRSLSLRERMLLEAFSEHIAVALDRLRLSDLSEQTRVLRESERLSKTLLDSMSHELRTPIAAIKGASGNLLALGTSGFSPAQQQMLAEIGQATERLDRLVGNALDLNRLESGAVQPQIDYCDPAELVNLCVAQAEQVLTTHNITVQLEPNLPIIKMDFVLTQTALMNLLSNAGAHTPPGTSVRVSAGMEESDFVIKVADGGPGIDPCILPRVFDKFVRGPHARAGGTGLGLSLVRGFIEAQHGSVTAGNQPGGGAVFKIRLPGLRWTGSFADKQSPVDAKL